MRYPMGSLFACVALAATTSAALATTRSSFVTVDSIADITAPTSNTGHTYTVTLGTNPTFTLGTSTYTITDVIGFYALSDDLDFSPLSALPTVGPSGSFSDDSTNSGPGAIAGWKSNPNNGLTTGQSLAFTLPANFPIADIDRLGFHVRINGVFPGTTGNTGNITGVFTQAGTPAPGAAALIGLGGLVAARRRRT